MIGNVLTLIAATAMVSAAPAQSENSAKAPSKAQDLNEIVCEKSEVLGSRVAVKKVCMTRAEWAERRRLDRQEIDKAQVGRGSCDGCQ